MFNKGKSAKFAGKIDSALQVFRDAINNLKSVKEEIELEDKRLAEEEAKIQLERKSLTDQRDAITLKIEKFADFI